MAGVLSPISEGLRFRSVRSDPRNSTSHDRAERVSTGSSRLLSTEARPLVQQVPSTAEVASEVVIASVGRSCAAEYLGKHHTSLLRHYYYVMSLNSHEDKYETLPAFAFQEVVLGDIIGRGGFSFVHEIRKVRPQEVYDTGNEEAAARAKFSSTLKRESGNATPSNKDPTKLYVLKTLRPDLPEDEMNKGIIDLAVGKVSCLSLLVIFVSDRFFRGAISRGTLAPAHPLIARAFQFRPS